MAREKKEKVDLKGAIATLKDNKLVLTNEETEEIVENDLVSKILSLVQKYGSLSYEIKDYAPKVINRAPTYKYICPTCGKEIKTKVEDLHAVCKDCDVEFQPKE